MEDGVEGQTKRKTEKGLRFNLSTERTSLKAAVFIRPASAYRRCQYRGTDRDQEVQMVECPINLESLEEIKD